MILILLFLLPIVMTISARIFTHRPLTTADVICSAIDSASR